MRSFRLRCFWPEVRSGSLHALGFSGAGRQAVARIVQDVGLSLGLWCPNKKCWLKKKLKGNQPLQGFLNFETYPCGGCQTFSADILFQLAGLPVLAFLFTHVECGRLEGEDKAMVTSLDQSFGRSNLSADANGSACFRVEVFGSMLVPSAFLCRPQPDGKGRLQCRGGNRALRVQFCPACQPATGKTSFRAKRLDYLMVKRLPSGVVSHWSSTSTRNFRPPMVCWGNHDL